MKIIKKVTFLSIIFPLLILFTLFSCKDNLKLDSFKLSNKLDLKNYGTFNSLKIIDNSLFLLDATNSKLYMLDSDSLYSIIEVDIKNRAFLQDFDISDSLFYFSNTYDEIFILNENADIIDTIHISNPNRISLSLNNKELITTERISKFNIPRIISYDFNSENEIKMIELENILVKNTLSSVKPIFNSEIIVKNNDEKIISVLSNRSKSIYSFIPQNDSYRIIHTPLILDTKYSKKMNLSNLALRFGNFYYFKDKLKVIAETINNNERYLLTFKLNNMALELNKVERFNDKFDITVCVITEKDIYAYDYINQNLLFYKF